MASTFTLEFEDRIETDIEYYWGFNNLIINQSYSVYAHPTPEPTRFDYDYAGCPSYNLEWSDYTTFLGYPGNDLSHINQWEGTSTYAFWFNDANKTSDWLLQSSTYAAMQGSSSLDLTLDLVEENNQRAFCRTPMITLRDDSQFVSIIFSLVFVIYTYLCILSAIIINNEI